MSLIHPEEMIESIHLFESSDGSCCEFSNDFLKRKLKEALYNEDIINLARGEGRSRLINDIIVHPEILFDWGQKSMHAYLNSKDQVLRDFCDPETVNKGLIVCYLDKYLYQLEKFILRYDELKVSDNVGNRVEQLRNNILKEENLNKLKLIKEWLIYAFHTMGVKEFTKISPCISCSNDYNRFEIAKRFGSNRGRNPYYVLMDSWVNKLDEGITFRRTEYVNEQLSSYGLRWFKNYNSEIMLKYAIFPQQLVGYYFVDHGNIVKYVVNSNYLYEWKNNINFSIGTPIYFDQNIDFNILGPYNTVYEYWNGNYRVASRRY